MSAKVGPFEALNT